MSKTDYSKINALIKARQMVDTATQKANQKGIYTDEQYIDRLRKQNKQLLINTAYNSAKSATKAREYTEWMSPLDRIQDGTKDSFAGTFGNATSTVLKADPKISGKQYLDETERLAVNKLDKQKQFNDPNNLKSLKEDFKKEFDNMMKHDPEKSVAASYKSADEYAEAMIKEASDRLMLTKEEQQVLKQQAKYKPLGFLDGLGEGMQGVLDPYDGGLTKYLGVGALNQVSGWLEKLGEADILRDVEGRTVEDQYNQSKVFDEVSKELSDGERVAKLITNTDSPLWAKNMWDPEVWNTDDIKKVGKADYVNDAYQYYEDKDRSELFNPENLTGDSVKDFVDNALNMVELYKRNPTLFASDTAGQLKYALPGVGTAAIVADWSNATDEMVQAQRAKTGNYMLDDEQQSEVSKNSAGLLITQKLGQHLTKGAIKGTGIGTAVSSGTEKATGALSNAISKIPGSSTIAGKAVTGASGRLGRTGLAIGTEALGEGLQETMEGVFQAYGSGSTPNAAELGQQFGAGAAIGGGMASVGYGSNLVKETVRGTQDTYDKVVNAEAYVSDEDSLDVTKETYDPSRVISRRADEVSTSNVTEEGLNTAKKEMDTILADSRNHLRGLREQQSKIQRSEEIMREIRNPDLSVDEKQALKTELESIIEDVQNGPTPQELDAQITRAEESLDKAEASYMKGYRQLDDIRANKGFGEFSDPNLAEVDADGKPVPQLKEYQVSETKPAKDIKKITSDLSVNDIDAEIDSALEISETRTQELESKVATLEESDAEIDAIESRMQNLDKQIQSREIAIKQAKSPEQAESLKAIQEQAKVELRDLYDQRSALVRERTLNGTLDTKATIKELEEAKKANEALKTKATKVKEERTKKISELNKRMEQLQGKTDARSIKEYEKLSDELSELTEGRLNNKQRQVRQATREAEKAARQEAAYDRASKKLDELREREAQIAQDIESEKKGRNDTTSIGLLNQELKDVRGRIKKFEGTLKKHDKATLSKKTRQTKDTLDELLGKKRPKKTTKAGKKGAKTVETEDGVFTREELLEQRESAESVLEATKEKLKETKKDSDTYKALEGFIKNTEARIREIDNNIRTLDGVTKERVKVTKGGNTTTEVVKDDDTLTRKLRNALKLNEAGDSLLGIELTAQKIATLLELARVLDEMRVKENALKNSDQVTDNILNGDAENGWFGLRDYETALALAIENDDVESFNRYIGKLQIFMESHVSKSAALDKALDAQKTGGAQVVYRIKGSRTEWAVRPASKVESTGLPYKLRKTGSILVKANTAKLANTVRNEAELITDKFNTLKELQSELTEQDTGSERGKGLVGKGAGKKPTPPKTPKPKEPEGKGKGKGTGGLVQTKIKEAKELAPKYTEKKSGELADITHYFDKEDNAEYMKFNILMWAKHFKNIVEKPYDAVFNEMRAIGAIATKSIAFGTIGQYRGDFDYDRVSKGAKVDDPLYEQWAADKEATKGYQDWEAVFHEEFAGHNNSKLVYGQEYTSDDIVAVILNYSEDNAEIEAARMAEIDAAIEAGATILLPKAYKDKDKRTQDMIKYLESKGYSLAPKEKRLSRKFGSKNFKVQSFIKTGTDTGNNTDTNTDTNNTGVKTPKGLSKPISTKDKPLDVYVDGSDIKGTGAIGFGVFINHNGKEHAISGAYDTKDLKDLEKELGIKLSKAPSNAVMEFFGALIAIKNTPANEYLQISQDLEGSQLWILSGILEHLSGQQFNTKAAYTSWYKQQSPAQQKELARQVKEIIGLDPDLLAKKIFKGETESKGYYAADPTVRAIQQQIVQEILARQGKITYKWVKGHAGIEGNEKVDAVAKDRKKYNTYKDLFTSEGKKEDNTDGKPKDEDNDKNSDKEDSNKEEESSTETETEAKPTTIAKFFEKAKKWKLPAERLYNAIKEGDWKHFSVPAIKTNVAVADGKLDVNESILQQKDTMLNSQKDFFNKYIATKDYEGLAKLLGFELTEANKRQLDAFIRLHNRISERVSEALKVPTEDQSYEDNPLYKHLVKTRPVLDKNGKPIVTKKGVARTESYLEDNVVTALALSVFQHIQTGGRNPYLDRDQIHDVHGIDEYTQINKSTQAIVSKWGSQRGFVFQDLGKGAIRALGLRAGNDADLRILNKLEAELGALAYVIVTERTDDPLFISKESNEVKDSDGNPGLLTNGERIRTLVSGMSKGRAIKFLTDLSKSKYDEETGEAVISDGMMSRIKNAKNTKEIVEILKEANNSYMFSAVHLVRPAISRYWDKKNKEMVSLYNPDILDILESSKKEKGEKDLLNELFDSAYSREEPLNEKPETFDQDTVIKGSTKVPRNQHEALLKISQQEWGVETAKADMMINLYDNNREQFYKLVGVKSDEEILAMHPSDRETAYTDRRIAMDMYEKQIAWLKGRKDDKSGTFAGYWQKPVVWVNQRVGYASTLWNAQTNMFARMLSNLKTWTTDIDINESIIPKKPSDITLHGRFFLMLAENMEGASNHMDFGELTYNGVTYPKKAYRKSAKTVDKVLPQDFLPRFLNYLETSPVIADAVSAINNLHENGSITDSESDAISKAVAELDQGELSLGALMEYAAYLRAKEAGTGTHTTTMGSQSDGITNGPMITKFLLAVATPAIRIMGGIIGKKDTAEGIIDFFETKARGYKDLYENTGSAMSKSLEQYIPQGSLLESTLATISLIDDDFGSRSWAKKLLTPFNYGSGIPRLRDAINGNVVEKFEREYKDIFAENTTKADRLKALGIFNKKLKAIATEYNDMFLHRNINEANLEVELEKLVVIHNGQRSTDKMVETSFDKDTKIQMLGELYKAAPNATPVDILNKVSYILRQSNSAVSDTAITIDQIEGDISRDILNAVDSLANITFGTAAIRSIEKEEAAYIKKRDLLTEMANLAYANYDALRRAYISEYAADPNNPTVAEMQKIDRMLASSKAAVASAMSNLGLDNNGRRAQAIGSGIDLEKTTFRTSTGLKIPFNTLNREQGDKATESYSYGFTYTEMGEPGVRTLALMIQSLDAATSIQAIAEIAGMNFHDANVFGLKDLAQGVSAQNRNFFKTIIRYEPSLEIAESVLRPIYAARDLYRSKDASPLLKGRAESIMQSMRSRQDEIIEMIHSAYDNEMFKLIQSINNDEYIHQYGGLGGVYKITEADKAEMKKRYLELSKERDDKILEFTNLIENYTVPEEVEENTLEEEVTNPNNTETIVSQLKELDSLEKRALIDQALASPEINVRELISLIKELLSTTSADPKNYRGLLETLEALNDDTLGDIKIKYVERDFEAASSGYAPSSIRYSRSQKALLIPALVSESMHNGSLVKTTHNLQNTVKQIPLEHVLRELAIATYHQNMYFIRNGSNVHPEMRKAYHEMVTISDLLQYSVRYQRFFDLENEADRAAFELLEKTFTGNKFKKNPEDLIYLIQHDPAIKEALTRIPSDLGFGDVPSIFNRLKRAFIRVFTKGDLNKVNAGKTLADLVFGLGDGLVNEVKALRLGTVTGNPMTVNGLIQASFDTHENPWTRQDKYDFVTHVDNRLMLELVKLKHQYKGQHIPIDVAINVVKSALLSYPLPKDGSDNNGYRDLLLGMLNVVERHRHAANAIENFVLAESIEDFDGTAVPSKYAYGAINRRGRSAYRSTDGQGKGTVVFHTDTIGSGYLSASTFVHELYHAMTSPMLNNYLPENAPQKDVERSRKISEIKIELDSLRSQIVEAVNKKLAEGELTNTQIHAITYALTGDKYYERTSLEDGTIQFVHTGITDHKNNPYQPQFDGAPAVDEFLAEFTSNKHLINVLNDIDVDMKKRKKSKDGNESISSFYNEVLTAVGALEPNGKYAKSSTNALRNFGLIYAELNHAITDGEYRETDTGLLKPYNDTFYGFNAGLSYLLPEEQAKSIANNFSKFLDGVVVPFLEQQADSVIKEGDNVGVSATSTSSTAMPVEVYKQWEALITKVATTKNVTDKFNVMLEIEVLLKQFRKTYPDYLSEILPSHLIELDPKILNAKEREVRNQAIKDLEASSKEAETETSVLTLLTDIRMAFHDLFNGIKGQSFNDLKADISNQDASIIRKLYNEGLLNIPLSILNNRQKKAAAITQLLMADSNIPIVPGSLARPHRVFTSEYNAVSNEMQKLSKAASEASDALMHPDEDIQDLALSNLDAAFSEFKEMQPLYNGLIPVRVLRMISPELLSEDDKALLKLASSKEYLNMLKLEAVFEGGNLDLLEATLKEVRKDPNYLDYMFDWMILNIPNRLRTAEENELIKTAEIPFHIPPTLQEAVDTAHDIKQSFVLQREEDMNADLGGAVRDEERFRPEQIADFLGTQTDRDNSYLNNIIKNVINPLMDKIPQALIEGYDYTKVWHDAIISGNAVYTSRAIDAGFDLDDQQAYVLEVLEVALLNTLNDVANTTAFRQLQRSYQQAKDTVRVEDFHNGNWNEATREEKDIAYAKYNLVFRPAVGGTSDGTSDYLSNFAALALVSPEMQRVLSFSPESVRDPAPDSIFEKLIKLFDKVVEFWDDKTTDVRSTDSINDRVASLTNTLATIYYKGHDRLVENERNRFLDLEENLAKIGDNIIEKLRAAGVVALSVPGLRDTNPAKVGRSFLEGKFKDFDKYVNHLLDYVQPNKPLNGVRETFNEIVGTLEGEEHKTAVSLFHATKAIEQERGAVIEAVAKAMLEAFSSENQDMSKEEHKGITNTLLRTDAHVLLKAHGFNTVMQYVRDPSSLSTEIQRVEDILAKHPQGNEYIHRARALATYMVQKKAPNTMLAKNAYAIAERVGTGKEASYTQQDLENIDQLISLYALRQTKSEDKQAMLEVLDKEASNTKEVTGLEYLVLSHAEASKTADDLFDENPYSKIKGHVPTILNPNKGFVVVTPREVSLYEQMGYKKADTLDQSALADLRGDRVLMTVSNTGKQRYVSGALSIEDANRSGTTVIRKGDVGFDTLVKKTQREMARAGATFFNDPSNNTNVTGNLIPAYDQNGEIIAFSYEMSGAGLDTYLDRNNNPITLLSQYKGSNLGKKHFPQQNNRIVDFAMDQYANAQDTDKRKFVKVSPDSKNAKVRQYWNSLPKETQMYIEAKNGGQFLYIRNDELNMMMGYRKFSPGAAFDKPSFERNLLEAAYVALFELPFRGKAKLRHDQALGLWLDIIKKLKDFIAIRNFKVLWGNIKSNVAFLMLNASDPVNAIRDVKDALTYSLAYQKQAQELNQLKHEMKIGLTSPEKTARFVVLQDSIARNPLRDFIEAGMMPMIVNDMSFKQGEVEYDTALNKGIDAVYGRLPKPISTTLDYALASPGTPLYSFLSNATQQSDFVFKYAMYKQELRKGRTKEQAMAVAREVYIDYDIPTNRGVQFMNDVGLWMFTKFALRIQRALLRYAREKPGKLVGEHLVSTYVLDNPSLLSLNLANYFMGGRNPFRVPTDGVLTMWGNATPIQALYAAVN